MSYVDARRHGRHRDTSAAKVRSATRRYYASTRGNGHTPLLMMRASPYVYAVKMPLLHVDARYTIRWRGIAQAANIISHASVSARTCALLPRYAGYRF